MSDFRRYQPRHSASVSGGRRWLWIVGGILLIVIVWWVWPRGSSSDRQSTTNTSSSDGISLVNDTLTNTNTPSTNTNSATTGSVAAVPDSWTNFSVSSCPSTIGSFGTTQRAALTFDLSAANDQAKQLLQMLQQQRIPATFFSTGDFADKNAAFVKSVADAGFGVYSRGQKSVDMTTLSADAVATSLTSADTAISTATGRTAKPLLRPPYGNTSAALVSAANAAGYCVVTWSVDGFDWQDGTTADQVATRVIDKLAPGMIIDLHAGYDVTQEAVSAIVTQLKSKNYSLVSLADLLQPS